MKLLIVSVVVDSLVMICSAIWRESGAVKAIREKYHQLLSDAGVAEVDKTKEKDWKNQVNRILDLSRNETGVGPYRTFLCEAIAYNSWGSLKDFDEEPIIDKCSYESGRDMFHITHRYIDLNGRTHICPDQNLRIEKGIDSYRTINLFSPSCKIEK
jgi:hypothetical protein